MQDFTGTFLDIRGVEERSVPVWWRTQRLWVRSVLDAPLARRSSACGAPEQRSDTGEVEAVEEEFFSLHLIGLRRGCPPHHEPFKPDEDWTGQQPTQ